MAADGSPGTLWSRLKASLLAPQAEAALVQRQESFAGPRLAGDAEQPLPPHLVTIVGKVHRHAHRLTDEDVQAALAAGVSQEALFELIVLAAVGAATQRLEAGLAAVSAPPAQETDHAS